MVIIANPGWLLTTGMGQVEELDIQVSNLKTCSSTANEFWLAESLHESLKNVIRDYKDDDDNTTLPVNVIIPSSTASEAGSLIVGIYINN